MLCKSTNLLHGIYFLAVLWNEKEGIGASQGGKMGTKKNHSNELLQSFPAPLFERQYTRLIPDGISPASPPAILSAPP